MSGYMDVLQSKYSELKVSFSDTWVQFHEGKSLEHFQTFTPWKKLAIVVTSLAIGLLVGAVVSNLPLGSLLSVPSVIFTTFVCFAYFTKPSIDNGYISKALAYFGK